MLCKIRMEHFCCVSRRLTRSRGRGGFGDSALCALFQRDPHKVLALHAWLKGTRDAQRCLVTPSTSSATASITSAIDSMAPLPTSFQPFPFDSFGVEDEALPVDEFEPTEPMHRFWTVGDIRWHVAEAVRDLAADEGPSSQHWTTLHSLLTVSREFTGPAAACLWGHLTSLTPLIQCVPSCIWRYDGSLVRP